jgi:uncharacterized protein YkwD
MVRQFLTACAVVVGLVGSVAAEQGYYYNGVYYSNPSSQTQTVSQNSQTVYYQTADGKLVTYNPYATQTSYQSNATASASTTVSSGNVAAQMMLERNNAHRASRGMSGHRLSHALTQAAQNHANYMASTGSFSHSSNGGPQSRASMYGFGGGVRENIAMGQTTVTSAFSSWVTSSGHYANLMSSTNAAGFGYAVSSSGQMYWVAVYGNE